PLAEMSYTPGANGLSFLTLANSGLPLFTNGSVAINFSLKVAAAVNFVGAVGSASTTATDSLNYYDLTDPSQAVLLYQQSLPGGNGGLHAANGNAVAQVIFGQNPVTATK